MLGHGKSATPAVGPATGAATVVRVERRRLRPGRGRSHSAVGGARGCAVPAGAPQRSNGVGADIENSASAAPAGPAAALAPVVWQAPARSAAAAPGQRRLARCRRPLL